MNQRSLGTISNSLIKNFVPLDSRRGVIWVDGQFYHWQNAKIHILTHGLHYASSVFEGIRVYKSKIFKLEEHILRLSASASLLGFRLPYSHDYICKITHDTVCRQKITNGYIRPIVWLGSEDLGIYSEVSIVHLAIAAWEWESEFLGLIADKGLSLTVSRWIKPSPNMAPIQAKAAGFYMMNTISRREAKTNGYDDAIFLDSQGFVTEATCANIFLVKNGKIKTPPPNCCLNGITRQTVINLASKINIKVSEERITLKDISSADEAFLTGTAFEIQPISTIDSSRFQVGTVTKLIKKAYFDLIQNGSGF